MQEVLVDYAFQFTLANLAWIEAELSEAPLAACKRHHARKRCKVALRIARLGDLGVLLLLLLTMFRLLAANGCDWRGLEDVNCMLIRAASDVGARVPFKVERLDVHWLASTANFSDLLAQSCVEKPD